MESNAKKKREEAKDDTIEDIHVKNPAHFPEDSISSISWYPNPDHKLFAASSWDGQIRLYTVSGIYGEDQLIQKGLLQYPEPILSINFNSDGNVIYASCGDSTVQAFDLKKGKCIKVGEHQGPVKDSFWIPQLDSLVTGSFDQSIRFWKIGNQNPIAYTIMDHQVHAMDVKFPYMLVGTSQEKLILQDLRKLENKEFEMFKMPEVQAQITSVSFFENLGGYAVGTMDGYAHLNEIQKESRFSDQLIHSTFHSFKNQRGTGVSDLDTQNVLQPCNSIGFNPRQERSLFIAEGGKGVITFWDLQTQNKTKVLETNQVPVTVAKVSIDGQYLAYGTGNDWHKGYEGRAIFKNDIIVHKITDDELKNPDVVLQDRFKH